MLGLFFTWNGFLIEGFHMVDFSNLIVGREYDRPQLAELWGYETYNAISRGVVSPKGQALLIFFITKEKQESLTQYIDHIDNDMLFWEGEKGHGNDKRIVSQKDEIRVFHRDRHHQDFTYKGKALLEKYRLYSDRPSCFSFRLVDLTPVVELETVAETSPAYIAFSTVRSAVIASRIGQGRFRDESLKIWKNCCISGLTKENVLIASHIKPWRVSDNRERLDGYNSLLLYPSILSILTVGIDSVAGGRSNGQIYQGRVEGVS
jgi:hypothetical protein